MSQISFCPKCGGKLAVDDAFCGNCGQPLPAAQAPDGPEQPTSPAAFEAAAADDSESGFPIVGIVVSLLLLAVVVVNVRDWMGWNSTDEEQKPASTTFQEWADEGFVRPQVPEKGEFTNVKKGSDAQSLDSFDELLSEMVMQEIENAESQPGGRLVDLPGPGTAPGLPGAGMPVTVPSTAPPASARIPYIEPGDQVFASGILQKTCDTGLRSITFELSIVSNGAVTGDVLSSGWLVIPLKGLLTPAGELTISGQTPDGNVMQANGRLRYEDGAIFLKGGGQYQLRWQDVQRSGQCSGQWLTEVL